MAIVRLSGPRAHVAAQQIIKASLPTPRQAALVSLFDPAQGQAIDQALLLCFDAPASFTGEHVVEFHVHGGRAVVAALFSALSHIDGLRMAEAGEFTRRAFDNGRLDLSQAEGLSDLIAAETEMQRVQALAQAGGRLRDRVESWRSRLVTILADIEALIDFAEEEAEVAAGVDAALAPIAELAQEIAAMLATASLGERLRDGFTIVISGAPNVGKSSLMNAVAGRDVAIVTPVAGTTRDIIELPIDLGGIAATLVDTAGLRETQDIVEAEGIRRARQRAAKADLVLNLILPDEKPLAGGLVIVNKSDLGDGFIGWREGVLHMAAATGAGLDLLLAYLRDWAAAQVPVHEPVLISRARHRDALQLCHDELQRAANEPDLVLRAESLRLAASALGRITGRVGVEELLDSIFGRFCIGK